MSAWEPVTRKGKARPARGGGGLGLADLRAAGVRDGRGGGGAAVSGGGGGGRGAPRQCSKLALSDTKPNIYDRPNTVVIDSHEFSVLPPIEELVPFIFENVLREKRTRRSSRTLCPCSAMRTPGSISSR